MQKSNTAASVVNTAKNEVGYLEKRSARNEDSKTANAGSNNYTKYGKWFGLDGTYWCMEFVSWVFDNACSDGRYVLGGYTASCNTAMSTFKKFDRFDKTPKVGDVIFFSGSRHGGANHVGIVTAVSANTVHTVEGNTSGGSAVIDNGGGVAAKSYLRSNSRILGYGHPRYTTTKNTKEEGFDLAILPTIKNGSTGESAKALQAILKSKYGCTLTVDGKFGTNSQKQLKVVQKKLGLSADGVCGAKTWKAVLI